MTIDIDFADHQVRLGEAVRELLSRRNTPEVIREVEAGGRGFSRELWNEMAGLGWLGIDIPEQYGGAGAGFLDVYPLFEELGRALVLGPYHDTVGVGANLVLELGTEQQKDAYLPGIVAGDCIMSLALLEASGGFAADDVELRADANSGGGHVLTGTKLLVGWALDATTIIVPALSHEGISLFLVEPDADGLSCAPLDNLPADALFEVAFEGVAVGRDALLGSLGGGWEPLQAAMIRGAVLQAGTIVGAARTVLEVTNQYAKDRVQFGIPIGKNQAVQYMVSDILIDLHRADLLNRQAAFRIDRGQLHRREAAISIAFAKQASRHLHRQAHEAHAGVAFIDEHVLTLYSKHAKLWENHFGDARHYRQMIADVLAG